MGHTIDFLQHYKEQNIERFMQFQFYNNENENRRKDTANKKYKVKRELS